MQSSKEHLRYKLQLNLTKRTTAKKDENFLDNFFLFIVYESRLLFLLAVAYLYS